MTQYTFSTRKLTDALNNRLIRCYFNETVEHKTVPVIDPDTGEQTGEEERTDYIYAAVDLAAPLIKDILVDAMIRTHYSQSAVEAIFRHKLAGEDADHEFEAFNDFAEAIKVRAKEILEEA